MSQSAEAPAPRFSFPHPDALRQQFIRFVVFIRARASDDGESPGRERRPEPRGEQVEVAEVYSPVVVEIALREVAVRLTEVRGEDVEVLEVHGPVVVGVAGKEE